MSTVTRTSHSPPSLPSFAQAFPNAGLEGLPPLHHLARKRQRDDREHDDRPVKRESPSPPPPPAAATEHDQLDPSPSPPRARPSKKRRIVPAPDDRDSLSPVVVVSTPPSSDQGALEQVRAMLSIKQKQKELIDQRRGSAAGLLQPSPPAAPAPARPPPPVRRPSAAGPAASAATSPKAPHLAPAPRRRKSTNGHPAPAPPTPAPPPPPPIAKSSTRAAPPRPLMLAPHALARRLEPLVHSAPPIGAGAPMRVPVLPPVPITPGVPIARSARPADGRAGFLQLFEDFYDSLADARLLKQWLQEQLARSSAMLEQQQQRVEDAVAPLRNEVDGLRRRVGELEELLYRERAGGGGGGFVFPERGSEPSEGRLSTSAVRLDHPHRPSPLRRSGERDA